MSSSLAVGLLERAKEVNPEPLRIPIEKTKDVVVASVIENNSYGFATLFVQVLPEDVGAQLSHEEQRQQLEHFMFDGDERFRPSFSGAISTIKTNCKGWALDEALDEFYRRYSNYWDDSRNARVNSDDGRKLVRLRLQILLFR